MRILFVARSKKGYVAPFITEQIAALEGLGIECFFWGVFKKGLLGYLVHYPGLKKAIRIFRPDIVHAHYGFCGVLANLQRKVPVVTTYHGSDINNSKALGLSRLAIRFSRFNIFVSQKNVETARPFQSFALIPCGINLDDYPLTEKGEARRRMRLQQDKQYVLFAGAFDNSVKNTPLARAAVSLLGDVELLELKGYSRQEVALLMNAVDAFLMTSHTEGSPQVIKEALACGCPIVSVDVGDVKERIVGIDGCQVVPSDAQSIAEALRRAIAFEGRTKGREAIVRDGLTNVQIAEEIKRVYQSVVG